MSENEIAKRRSVANLKIWQPREREMPQSEILLWTTPEGPPRALQASECRELLDPTRASCLILAQRQPGKFINSGRASRLHLSIGERALLARELITGRKPNQKLQENHQDSLDGSRSSFQLANSTPPQGVIDCAIAPSTRIPLRRGHGIFMQKLTEQVYNYFTTL